MTETHVGFSSKRAAHAVSLKTTQANGFVAAGAEKRWTLFDQLEAGTHDVFTVISEGADGRHVARTIFAADLDDARQTHRENYADEPIVAVQQ